MKFTLSWLKHHLDTTASVAEICAALTDLGLEVEGVEDPAERLGAFTIGKVLEAQQHPDADKLRLCKVESDEGVLQIICGAPNARAGITVVLAKPGTYVPGIDATIQIGKIRGIESHGMMCSEREMELSDEHDGIIELPSGEIGMRFVDWLAEHDPAKVDPVIEIAITPNRPDALGVRGIARDLAARGLGQLKPCDTPLIKGQFESPIGVRIADDAREVAPHFTMRMIRGVKNGPSPQWLQQILKAIGLRPINFLVDVTNFMTFDQNRPLHVFDADKVAGALLVHRAKGGESFRALDEKTYTLLAGQTVISDDKGVESLAGIMGGEATGVSEETVNVLVESAWWDPVHTAYTGRALKITSDARYRFERGVDPAFTAPGLDHAVQMILDHAGGEASHLVEAGAAPDHSRSYPFMPERVASLVGMDIEAAEQRRILSALGIEIDASGAAHIPSWRPDMKASVDLIEEVARIASLEGLQGQPLPRLAPGVAKPVLTREQKRQSRARRALASLGYNECVTYSFIDEAAAKAFGGGSLEVALENPISSEMSHMRPSLLPGLLQAAARNQARGLMDIALFEVGTVFHGGEPEEAELHATGVLIGHTAVKNHFGSRRPVDLYDAKADAEAVLAALGAPEKRMVMRGTNPWWHPGRSGKLTLGPKNVLVGFGELHPRVLEAMKIKGPAVAFAIHIERIPVPKTQTAARPALTLHDLQSVERDFAFVVDESVEAHSLINAIKGADKALIADVRLFDQFVGAAAQKALGEGKKSLAITVCFQPEGTSLAEKDLELLSGKIIDKARKIGAELRG